MKIPYTEDELRRMPLDGAREDLLEQIVATPRATRPAGHRRAVRLALGSVAAAAVAVVGVSVAVQSGRPDPSSDAGTRSPSASAQGSAAPAPTADLSLAAMAERMPRFLLDDPAWQITTVYGFGSPTDGTLGFSSGTAGQSLQINWYPAGQYGSYFHDRNDDPSIGHEDTQLLGGPATLFTYGPHDHATMLRPDGDHFVEIRGDGLSRADYLALTAELREASVPDFLAALPASVTTPAEQDTRARSVLADVPVPRGFAFKPDGETLDPYQFGALVTGQVFCAWAEDYYAGDQAEKATAVAAMESSRHWKVFGAMKAEGGWPSVVWQYADRFAAGRPATAGPGPEGGVPSMSELRSGLGCH